MQSSSSVITPQQAGSLYGLFVERVKRSPNKVAYRFFCDEQWRDYTWQQMAEQVARWQAALASLGLQAGDRVGLMLRNCPYWVMFDQAAMALGLVVVPLFTMDRPENVAYIVNHADIKVFLFENAEQWQALCTVHEQLPEVVAFISINKLSASEMPIVDARLKFMADFLPEQASLLPPPAVSPDDLASLIYTSGTTGRSKGVMLSHANMLGNAAACLSFFHVDENDLFLSFLPLSHTFERTVGYYLTIMAGAVVAYARSIPQLSEDLQTIRPTLLISVPRIYERVYAGVKAKLAESSEFKRKLFDFTIETGWARFLYQQGRGAWQPSFLLWPILHKLVAQKVLDRLGGRLRAALSGGAALPPEVSRVFIGLGLSVVQGYGLTESSPVISGNHPDRNFPDSVGQPIPDVQVRLGPKNELLIKGPNVMLGYWRNPEATKAIIDEDGWLNTGDVVRISETGHIYITGRTKEIIVMSNGEKLPPTDMEQAILRDSLFEQVMVYGEAKPYLVALAVLNPDNWQQLCKQVGIRDDMPESLTDSRVQSEVLQRIAARLRGFPGYANIHRVLLLREPWTIENGLLTPTLKLKRPEVAKRFDNEIQSLYKGH